MMADEHPATPWYREPWPWLLMIAPAAAVVAGIFTWWLAAHTNNSLVIDDYYREGRAINQQLARDGEASRLGLSATLANEPASRPASSSVPGGASGGIVLELASQAALPDWPESLTLKLVHATESALDAELRLAHQGNGRYRGAGILPANGHWIVQLEDPDRRWRLIGRTDRFDAPLLLRADSMIAGGGR
jgi:hypothetical protein